MASKDEAIEVEGIVKEALPNTMFRVELKMAILFWDILAEKCANTISVLFLVTV